MLRRHKTLSVAVATAATLIAGLAVGPAVTASAAPAAPAWSTHICHGTFSNPGRLIGVYWNVIVRGVCIVRNGPVLVQRNIWVGQNSVLVAAFAQRHSRLIVDRNLFVKKGGTLLLGCEASHFACLDDPHPKHPSLNSHSTVFGSLLGDRALGIVVHNSSIEQNVSQAAGGGGVTCRPQGAFVHFHSPAYSDYEDNFIRGNLWVRHLRSCFLGVLRNFIASSAIVNHNKMADPDAMEVLSNVILLNLVCRGNSPAVQYGDSHGKPNRVGRHALFQCGFHVLKPNPAGQHKHFSHISVPLR